MLAVAFEEFGVVYMFKLLFSFYFNCQLVKGQIQQKFGWGWGCISPSQPPGFYGPDFVDTIKMNIEFARSGMRTHKAWAMLNKSTQ